jgi:hypothetical protein
LSEAAGRPPLWVALLIGFSLALAGLGLGLEPALERLWPTWSMQQRLAFQGGGTARDLWDRSFVLSAGGGWRSVGPDGVDQGGRGDDVVLGDARSQSSLWELAHWPGPLYRIAGLAPSLLWIWGAFLAFRAPRAASTRREVLHAAALGSLGLLALGWWWFGFGYFWVDYRMEWDAAVDRLSNGLLLVRADTGFFGLVSVALFGVGIWWRLRGWREPVEPAQPAEF